MNRLSIEPSVVEIINSLLSIFFPVELVMKILVIVNQIDCTEDKYTFFILQCNFDITWLGVLNARKSRTSIIQLHNNVSQRQSTLPLFFTWLNPN